VPPCLTAYAKIRTSSTVPVHRPDLLNTARRKSRALWIPPNFTCLPSPVISSTRIAEPLGRHDINRKHHCGEHDVTPVICPYLLHKVVQQRLRRRCSTSTHLISLLSHIPRDTILLVTARTSMRHETSEALVAAFVVKRCQQERSSLRFIHTVN
jgi:hypothetical protein